MSDLSGWLIGELKTRGWSQRELARRAGISSSTVSDVLARVRAPSWDFCANVAGALDEEPDRLFVLAGLKRPMEPESLEEREALSLLHSLPPAARSAAVAMLRGLAGQQPSMIAVLREPSPEYVIDDELERELLDTFRRLPERWQVVILQDVKRTAELGMVRLMGEGEAKGD